MAIKCFNCKESYIIREVEDDDYDPQDYKFVGYHKPNSTCPYGIITYQNSISECELKINIFNGIK